MHFGHRKQRDAGYTYLRTVYVHVYVQTIIVHNPSAHHLHGIHLNQRSTRIQPTDSHLVKPWAWMSKQQLSYASWLHTNTSANTWGQIMAREKKQWHPIQSWCLMHDGHTWTHTANLRNWRPFLHLHQSKYLLACPPKTDSRQWQETDVCHMPAIQFRKLVPGAVRKFKCTGMTNLMHSVWTLVKITLQKTRVR